MTTQINTKGLEVTPELEKYITRKLARLNRKLSRKVRAYGSWNVSLTQTTRKEIRYSSCELVLALDEHKFVAQETTLHMHSAVDIAAVQVEQQLKAYAGARRRELVWRKLLK